MANSTIKHKRSYDASFSSKPIDNLPLDGHSCFLICTSSMGSTGINGQHSIYMVDISYDHQSANVVHLAGDTINVTATITNGCLTVELPSGYNRWLVFPMGRALFVGGT